MKKNAAYYFLLNNDFVLDKLSLSTLYIVNEMEHDQLHLWMDAMASLIRWFSIFYKSTYATDIYSYEYRRNCIRSNTIIDAFLSKYYTRSDHDKFVFFSKLIKFGFWDFNVTSLSYLNDCIFKRYLKGLFSNNDKETVVSEELKSFLHSIFCLFYHSRFLPNDRNNMLKKFSPVLRLDTSIFLGKTIAFFKSGHKGSFQSSLPLFYLLFNSMSVKESQCLSDIIALAVSKNISSDLVTEIVRYNKYNFAIDYKATYSILLHVVNPSVRQQRQSDFKGVIDQLLKYIKLDIDQLIQKMRDPIMDSYSELDDFFSKKKINHHVALKRV